MTGGSAERLRAITPAGMMAQVHLTMTDEYPYAYRPGDHLRDPGGLTTLP